MDRIERVDLGDVTLSCQVSGEGPLVLAAHGFPDDASTFEAQAKALVEAGYQVVLPTMRGYLPSSESKRGSYAPSDLGADLVGLADHFSPGEKVRLVGHDWGSIASFAAAALAPHRFSHLVTMAVPHARALLPRFGTKEQLARSWYIGLFQLPFVAELRLREDDLALVDRLWKDWSPGYEASAEELRRVKDGIRARVPAVLAYYRALGSPKGWIGRDRELLFAPVQVPTLHVHGVDDGCIGIECCAGAARFHEAGYAFHPIEDAGHFLTRERPDVVSGILLDFFRGT
ncbi:MAG: alpha/beta hydrolase [Polyangiales bacterium]